jgi:glycosyltransferase involved in cell wall biosynthesis/folate-dependent phosphoribosylglycinamide formyltransferase PurN
MAWRLFENGYEPIAVIVEKRGRIAGKRKASLVALLVSWGFRYTFKKILETLEIKFHYFARRILGERFKDPSYLSIEELALDYPVKIYNVDDHNSLDSVRFIEHLKPDIGILTNTRRICKQLIALPRYGFLNLHLSALPKYGGLESIFWGLYHGEKEIGATVHFVSEHIEEGDIALQNTIPVSRMDNEDSLYAKALWLGTAMMVKALKQLEAGTIQRRSQNREEATYFSWPVHEERAILRHQRKIRQLKEEVVSYRSGVLHLITRMTRGGAQENTLATIRGLREKGYEVTLVTGLAWGKEGEILSQAIEEKMDLMILPGLIREISVWRDLIVFFRLLHLMRQNRYAILHTHTSKAGFIGRFAGSLAGIPVIIHTPHGHVFHSYFSKSKERIFVRLERWMARMSDHLIALTDSCRREHLDLRIGKPKQWVVIPSGVNPKHFSEIDVIKKREIRARFGILPGAKIAGYIGRLSEIKGAGYFLEAIPKIKEAVPGTHFLFIGDGKERAALEERAKELEIASILHFAGHQEDPSVFLSIMDVLVVPSLNEGMGRVIVEGGFLKKAVVGTNVGGIPDLLKDGAGVLVEPRRSEAIEEAVIRLLRDSAFAGALGERLYARVADEFTEEEMIEHLDILYRDSLTRHGLKVPKGPIPIETSSLVP